MNRECGRFPASGGAGDGWRERVTDERFDIRRARADFKATTRRSNAAVAGDDGGAGGKRRRGG